MKNKIIACVLAILATTTVFAKDVIVTTDAKTIDAKIMEVSKTEIKYKESDNLDGPTFILPISDISTITYSSGKVVSYNSLPQATQQVIEPQNTQMGSTPKANENIASILLLSGNTITGELLEMNNKYVAYLNEKSDRIVVPASQIISVSLSNGQVKIYAEDANDHNTTTSTASIKQTSNERIIRYGSSYKYNGQYISKDEIASIFGSKDQVAYSYWKKAKGMEICGDVFLGLASGLAVGGLITVIWVDVIAGLVMNGVAVASLGVGIGLVLSAPKNYNHAIDIYNAKYDHASVQLRWSVAPTGVGMAIAF